MGRGLVLVTRVAGVCKNVYWWSTLWFCFRFFIRNNNDQKAINFKEIPPQTYGKITVWYYSYLEQIAVCQGLPRLTAIRRAWIIKDGHPDQTRSGGLPSTVWRCVTGGPRFWHRGNVLSWFKRQLEKAQHIICPPQGSSVFWRCLKHIDLFSIAKPLERIFLSLHKYFWFLGHLFSGLTVEAWKANGATY